MIFHFFHLSSDMVTSIRIRRIIILWGWKGSRETKCIQGLSTLGSALVTRVPTDWCRSPPSNLRTHPCIYLFVYFPLNTMIYCIYHIYMFHYLFFNLLLRFQSWPNFIGSSLTRELDGGEEEEAWRTYPPLWCPSPCFPVTYLVIDKCVAVWTRDITVRKHFTARVQYNSVVFVCNLYLYYICIIFCFRPIVSIEK